MARPPHFLSFLSYLNRNAQSAPRQQKCQQGGAENYSKTCGKCLAKLEFMQVIYYNRNDMIT